MKNKNKSQDNAVIGETDQDIEEISLSTDNHTPDGTMISSFSFITPENSSAEDLTDNRKVKTEASVCTPSVEGESYTIGRYYKLRYSTAKMLNEIKAAHPDVNVYMNTIVDEAIRYYYSSIIKV